jgi:hypothetical protein
MDQDALLGELEQFRKERERIRFNEVTRRLREIDKKLSDD